MMGKTPAGIFPQLSKKKLGSSISSKPNVPPPAPLQQKLKPLVPPRYPHEINLDFGFQAPVAQLCRQNPSQQCLRGIFGVGKTAKQNGHGFESCQLQTNLLQLRMCLNLKLSYANAPGKNSNQSSESFQRRQFISYL